MQSKVKVSDRLSDDPEDNFYINNMSLTRARVWIRIRARAIAGVKGNFRHRGLRVYSIPGFTSHLNCHDEHREVQ